MGHNLIGRRITDGPASFLSTAFELNKVNGQRASFVFGVLNSSAHSRDADGFSWDVSVDKERWDQFRPNGADVTRKPEHISVVELRNAMVEVVRRTGGISVDELHRETIRTFGAKRLTAGVDTRLNHGLQYGRHWAAGTARRVCATGQLAGTHPKWRQQKAALAISSAVY